MKKILIKTFICSFTVLSSSLLGISNVQATENSAEVNSTAREQIANSFNYDSITTSLKYLQSQGAIFTPAQETVFQRPFAELAEVDSENTVTNALGQGIDSSGNKVSLNVTKGSVVDQYYLDNMTNPNRISTMQHRKNSLILLMIPLSIGQRISAFDYDILSSDSSQFDDTASVTSADQFQQNRDFFAEHFNFEGMDNGEAVFENALIATNAEDNLDGVNFAFNAGNIYFPAFRTSYTIFGKGGTIDDGENVYTFDRMDKDRFLIAHEYAHGPIRSIVNFDGLGSIQEGALNEGLPDIFAAAITGGWELGSKTLNVANNGSSFRRNLATPSAYNIPGTTTPYPEKVSDLTDEMGSHHAGTIIGHQFYLLATGNYDNGLHTAGLGTESAIQIVYRALSLLPADPQFADYRAALEKVTIEMFGSNSPELTAVKDSLDATEIPTR